MKDNPSTVCWLGIHKYENFKELELTDVRGNVLGIVIVGQCNGCGKIKNNKIRTVEHSYN